MSPLRNKAEVHCSNRFLNWLNHSSTLRFAEWLLSIVSSSANSGETVCLLVYDYALMKVPLWMKVSLGKENFIIRSNWCSSGKFYRSNLTACSCFNHELSLIIVGILNKQTDKYQECLYYHEINFVSISPPFEAQWYRFETGYQIHTKYHTVILNICGNLLFHTNITITDDPDSILNRKWIDVRVLATSVFT